jgi:hypothetical protein
MPYTVMSRHQNAGQNHNILTANESFQNVVKFKYLRTRGTKQHCIHKKTKSRLILGNSCFHSVQKLLSSHLHSKNVNIKKHKIIILPVVLYGCETWSLTLREEQRLRVFENRVLRKTFGPKRKEMVGGCKRLHNLYASQNIRVIKSRTRWDGDVAHMGEMRNACKILVEKL